MSQTEIKQFILSLIEDGLGPNAIAEELEDIYGINAEEAHELYLSVKGIDVKDEPRDSLALSTYKEEYAGTAYRLLLLGKSFEQIAEHFKVDSYTLNTWKHEIPEFGQAWTLALQTDFNVVETLLKLATGYSAKAVKVFNTKFGIEEYQYIEQFQPNLKAIETWLKTKYPQVWKDTQHIETNATYTVDAMSDEELENKLKGFGVSFEESKLSQLEVIEE